VRTSSKCQRPAASRRLILVECARKSFSQLRLIKIRNDLTFVPHKNLRRRRDKDKDTGALVRTGGPACCRINNRTIVMSNLCQRLKSHYGRPFRKTLPTFGTGRSKDNDELGLPTNTSDRWLSRNLQNCVDHGLTNRHVGLTPDESASSTKPAIISFGKHFKRDLPHTINTLQRRNSR
jgi:hypothetical protein